MAGGYVIFGKTFQAYQVWVQLLCLRTGDAHRPNARSPSASTNVFGPQLSYATLSLVGAGILLATSGKKEAKPTPAINAQSPQEEDFIT